MRQQRKDVEPGPSTLESSGELEKKVPHKAGDVAPHLMACRGVGLGVGEGVQEKTKEKEIGKSVLSV